MLTLKQTGKVCSVCVYVCVCPLFLSRLLRCRISHNLHTHTHTHTQVQPDLPVVLLGKKFWNDIVNWKAICEYGVINEKDVSDLFMADTVDEVRVCVCVCVCVCVYVCVCICMMGSSRTNFVPLFYILPLLLTITHSLSLTHTHTHTHTHTQAFDYLLTRLTKPPADNVFSEFDEANANAVDNVNSVVA